MSKEPITYASGCAGVEAATEAWKPLGWKAVWYAQYDPEHNYEKNGPDFPSRVLQHHYPHVPNLGDMLKLRQNKIYRESNFHVWIAGTPCQSFSIAGLRKGLYDERGNLALEFVRVLIEKRPPWFVWENVPGVLSSGGTEETYGNFPETAKDFACILSAFTGRDIAPQEFTTAGAIEGEFYSIAWRVLDSQYFGVPQRRRRIIVVGHLGKDWRPPVAVLFERESLRRDLTPSRKKRKGTTGPTEGSAGTYCKGYRLTGFHKYEDDNTSSTVRKRDFKSPTDIIIQEPIAYDTTQITSKVNGSNPKPGDPCHPLTKTGHVPIVIDRAAFNSGENAKYAIQISESQTCPTLTSASSSHAVCYAAPEPIAFKVRGGKEGGGKGYLGSDEHAFALKKIDDQYVFAPAYGIKSTAIGREAHNGGNGLGVKEEEADTLTKSDRHAVCYSPLPNKYMVRRLTPVECHRLQGFPDDYCAIPGATDRNQYEAMGNSMTIQVIRWVGTRIQMFEDLQLTSSAHAVSK